MGPARGQREGNVNREVTQREAALHEEVLLLKDMVRARQHDTRTRQHDVDKLRQRVRSLQSRDPPPTPSSTMAQRVPIAGAVIVSTPQDLSLIDAKKGLNMFRKVEVPVLGIVENMSYFHCPHCGERSDIFSHGGASQAAKQMDVDFLGEVPLDMAIRAGGDDPAGA